MMQPLISHLPYMAVQGKRYTHHLNSAESLLRRLLLLLLLTAKQPLEFLPALNG